MSYEAMDVSPIAFFRIYTHAGKEAALSLSIDTNGPIAKTVLMPGDPLRAEFIAENFLENPICYTKSRNMLGFTGKYKGTTLSVQGSGMGMPSMGIYSWELFNELGVDSILRIGTMGAFQPELHIGDVVLSLSASTDSNYMDMFRLSGTYSPCISLLALRALAKAAEQDGISFAAGNTLSSDHLYEIDENWWKPWKHMGVLGVEMEAAALYANAAYCGKNAGALMTVSDHFITGEKASKEEREHEFRSMMKIALDAAVLLEK
ncbi:MAG: purine-nucleoside phosphorylase [Eubacteriales bacterium]|nr:purine-nucleoside phosphorylase [Eubacteriales bacterium]